MTGTGLLTEICDPYGAESGIKLLGGLYPENQVGRIMWHCSNHAAARYRMICQGGEYGSRTAPDGGSVAGYVCDGGHQGQIMPLCLDHRREIAKRQSEACPRCLYPESTVPLFKRIEVLTQQITAITSSPFVNYSHLARLTSQQDQLMAEGDELIARGIVHKCRLSLVEVS